MVAANTVNGASLSNEREGYIRKRMLLFNDIILICKAHKGVNNEHGREEFDDTSIEGVNELELVLDMDSVKLNHTILGKTGETLESFARDLLSDKGKVDMKRRWSAAGAGVVSENGKISSDKAVELIYYRSRTKHEIRLHFYAEDQMLHECWVNEIESVLLSTHLNSPLSKTVGWHHAVVKRGVNSAAYNGELKILKCLLQAEQYNMVDIDKLDDSGMSPLMWASLNGHTLTCRLLLEHGANPDIRQTGGENTALLFAASKGHVDIVRSLIAAGSHVQERNAAGHTATELALFHCVCEQDNKEANKRMKKVVVGYCTARELDWTKGTTKDLLP